MNCHSLARPCQSPLAARWRTIAPRVASWTVTRPSTGGQTRPIGTEESGVLGLRGPRLVIDVLLPAAMPYILTGLKTAWAFGWRTVVAAELVFGVAGSQGGLGWYINTARYYLQTSQIFAGLVVISVLGIVVEGVFSAIESRTVVRWGMKR